MRFLFKKNQVIYVFLIFVFFINLLFFQNCQKNSETTNSEYISSHPVFASDISASSSDPTTSSLQTPLTPSLNLASVSLPVKYFCSKAGVAQVGGSVQSSQKLEIDVIAADGSIACQFADDSVRSMLLNEKKVPLGPCSNLPDGTYGFLLMNRALANFSTPLFPATSGRKLGSYYSFVQGGSLFVINPAVEWGMQPSLPLVVKNHVFTIGQGALISLLSAKAIFPGEQNFYSYSWLPALLGSGGGGFKVNAAVKPIDQGAVFVLYDTNNSNQNSGGRTGPGDICDSRGSPLVIDTASASNDPEPIELSKPLDGIMFDILGLNSFPSPNQPKRVSWVLNPQRYQFLVLPTKEGDVLSVDQMFGNNTQGPDGKFSENGFTALAKFDGKDINGDRQLQEPDGKIDAHDAIFSQLALWADLNRDGIAQPGELTKLRDAGITEIDLGYDPNYEETDRYGNQTKLKSVVKFEDGRVRLVFDLWFRYLNN